MESTGRLFTRHREDFTCDHCGIRVKGNGYTNHCPECFWSKHVDQSPGDRAAACGGAMEPVAVMLVSDRYVVTQRCVVCGHERRNRVGLHENSTALIALAKAIVDRHQKH